jgi:hypothetical protein
VILDKPEPVLRPKSLYLLMADDKCSGEAHMSYNLPYVRRTISIAPQINKWIQEFRARTMLSNPAAADMDYTSISNYLMAWGILFIQKYRAAPEDSSYVNQMVGERTQLTAQGILDAYEDLHKQRSQAPTEKS